MKKKYIVSLLTLALCVSVSSPSLLVAMNAPQNSAGIPAGHPGGKIDFNNVPPMSPEELAKWEEEVTKEIDAYVSTLSPEEQAQFHKEVEELTNVMSKMNPDELVKFIDTMLTEEGQQPLPLPTPTQEPAPVHVEEEKTVEKEKAPELPIKSVEAALNLIDELIMHIERFLRKSIMIPELPGNIDQWVSKNKIREWKNNLTWEILKADIESLNKQLNQLKDRDPKTKNYLYLGKLIEHESLYNNLIHIKQALTRHEPNVEAPAFGLGTVTPKSHDAIKQVLSTLAEAIYTLHVPTDITKVLGTSQAREKELKSEEDKKRTQAFEHSKRQQTHEGKRETVMPQPSRGGYSSEQPSYPSYTPHAGSYPYSNNSYYGGPDAYTNKPGASTSGKPGTPQPGEKGKADAAKKGAENSKAADTKLDETGKGLVTKIDKALEKFDENYGVLKTIYTKLAGGAAMDSALQEAVAKAQTSMNNALDLVKKLKTRGRTKQSPQAAISDALRDVTVPYKDHINELINQISTLKTTKGVVIPPAVDALYASLTDFNKEVGSATQPSGSMPAGAPIKPTPAPTGAPEESKNTVPTKQAPKPTTPEKESKRKAAPKEEAKLSPFEKQKDKLDDALYEAHVSLENPKIKGINKHIMDIGTPADIATANAVQEAVTACHAIVPHAERVRSTLKPLPAPEQKKLRNDLREEYAQYHKEFVRHEKELEALINHDLAHVELSKQYAFFGKEMTDEMIEKTHPTDTSKAKVLETLKNELKNPVTLSDLLKALQEADQAIEKI